MGVAGRAAASDHAARRRAFGRRALRAGNSLNSHLIRAWASNLATTRSGVAVRTSPSGPPLAVSRMLSPSLFRGGSTSVTPGGDAIVSPGGRGLDRASTQPVSSSIGFIGSPRRG